MKKHLCLLMVLAVLIMSLVGCTNTTPKNTTPENTTPNTTTPEDNLDNKNGLNG